jgi:hypothetical protein
LLARKLDQKPEDVEQALIEYAEHEILQCYEIAGRRYYWLRHWHKYQTLSKPTPSAYPAPPNASSLEGQRSPVGEPWETQESSGQSGNSSSEGEGKRNGRESEEKEKEPEDALPDGVTRFARTRTSSISSSSLSLKPLQEVAEQMASLLDLPLSQELCEVVQEYLPMSGLSLAGEAIEAHAWIADPRRNVKRQQMTPAFFRRWLRRSQQHGQLFAPTRRDKTRQEAAREQTLEQDQYAAYVNQLIAYYNRPEAVQRAV